MLWDIYWGMPATLAVMVAHDLHLFPFLAEGPRHLGEICAALNIAPRPAEALLAVCTAMGLTQFQDGRHVLTPTAEDYLLGNSPTDFGSFIDLWIACGSLMSFECLKQAVLSNSPQMYGGADVWKSHEERTALARHFTRAMHGQSMGAALAWPEALDLSGHRLLLDVGGGSGAHAIGATRRWPGLQAVVFDLPPVCQVAEEFIARHGLQGRVRSHAGDMWQDAFPPSDLHFYSDVFHDWPAEQCRFLTRKSFASLPPGGRLIVHELLYNDAKTGPLGAAAYSIVMLLVTAGQQYSGPELTTMFAEAGFTDIVVKPTFGYRSIITGRKP
jgi:hypothetical protein